MKYANVIVNISHENLDKVYAYAVPEEWRDKVGIGSQVIIPFGKGNRQTKGFVLELSEEPDFDLDKIKPITQVLEDGMVLESHFIQLAAWIREQYGGTMNAALRTVLPVKTKLKDKEQKYLHLAVSRERLSVYLEECHKKNYKARVRLGEILLDTPDLKMAEAVQVYKVSRDAIKKFEELGLLQISSQVVRRNPVETHLVAEKKIVLTKAQEEAVGYVWNNYQNSYHKPVLLHGITGSGKTEVYMELIERMEKLGKQSIVLIPEIALTTTMVTRYYQRFGDRMSVLHSKLSLGERSDQYQRAQNGEITVMLGPRSALFTPFSNLGLIIIDEEHEPTYKNETQPRYHAREVAIERAKMCGGMVVLGSATPSVETYYKSQTGQYGYVELQERIGESRLPLVYVVDLRKEMRQGNRSIFSRELQAAMEQALQEKKQILLFLNRRGYAGFVSCRACGEVLMCPHCDVSMTVHNQNVLQCHYCGYTIPMPHTCPKCGSKYIAGFGIGTQKVEAFARAAFPQAKIWRMDRDTTCKKGAYEKILENFQQGNGDILIGTQMIAKGHDFPNVTVVGALAADLSLFDGQYQSAERTFQLLSQVAGRAGRRKQQGSVWIQTYKPDHYSILAAQNHDYQAFYQEEIAYRKLMAYPPFGSILTIVLHCGREDLLQMAGELLAGVARKQAGEIFTVMGPANASIYKVKDVYRKVVYVKANEKEQLIKMKNLLEEYIRFSQYFRQIMVYYDM